VDSIVGREVGLCRYAVRGPYYVLGKVSNVHDVCVFASLPFWILDCSVEESKSKSSICTHTLASAKLSASPVSSDEAESEDTVGLTIITSSSLLVAE
jgi:hypothetical protein